MLIIAFSVDLVVHALTKRHQKRNTAESIPSLLEHFSSSSSAPLLEEAEEFSDTSDTSTDFCIMKCLLQILHWHLTVLLQIYVAFHCN